MGVDSANLKESDTANAPLWDHILDDDASVRHCEFDLFSRSDKALKYAIGGQECVAFIGYTNRTWVVMCDCGKCLKSLTVSRLIIWFIWYGCARRCQLNAQHVLKDYQSVYKGIYIQLHKFPFKSNKVRMIGCPHFALRPALAIQSISQLNYSWGWWACRNQQQQTRCSRCSTTKEISPLPLELLVQNSWMCIT